MTQPRPTDIAALWRDIRAQLEAAKRAVTMEIRNYPQPIAGCDAQIPALWDARDALVRALNRLEEAEREETPEAVEAFVAACPCLDDARQQAVREGLNSDRRTARSHAAAE
jgi:hypothetical protein